MSENNSEIKNLPENINGVHIHFVGIKGTGMAALVEILFHNGAIITGSDVSETFYTDAILNKLGLKAVSFSEKNITDDVQYVIYSSAYKLDKNPDLVAAVQKNIPCILYSEALGGYSRYAYSCGICGVHGKTSTTGLVGTILKEIDLPAQVLAGSVINSFGNNCTYTSSLIKTKDNSNCEAKCDSKNEKNGSSNKKNIFVAETCEYQRHFMAFYPKKIILTSVESDHQDFYPTYEDIRDAFVDYILKLPENGDLIYCADDSGAVETARLAKNKRADLNLIPYGEKADSEYKLVYKGVSNELNNFTVDFFTENQSDNKTFGIKIPGKHEVLDACGAIALVCQLLKEYGKNPADYKENIIKGLAQFKGGKRRSEVVGSFINKNGTSVVVVDDYGHHPTAVKTTVEGFRDFYKGRKVIVDFMSHTYSRTQSLLKEFSTCFDSADELILHKIYSSARENPSDFSITGKTLYEEVVKHCENQFESSNNQSKLQKENVKYFEQIMDAKEFVSNELNKTLDSKYPDGYLFITMGAGDNWTLGKAILEDE